MDILIKTLKNGFSIPEYGLGTYRIGGRAERDLQNDDAADIAAIQMNLTHGVTHIDTAESYANGYTEELVGQAIASHDREKLFLASKVWATNLRYDDVQKSCAESLRRLNTPYLDLYMLHRYSADIPLKDSMRALVELKGQGLIRNIGVSNFSVEHLKEAQSYSTCPVVCNQVHYNLEFREPETAGLLKYCQESDVMLVAFRPIQMGMFGEEVPLLLKQICEKYNKTPTQIALQWLLSQQSVVVISKTTNQKHLEENLGGVGWNMDTSDVERLRTEYPDQKEFSNSVNLA